MVHTSDSHATTLPDFSVALKQTIIEQDENAADSHTRSPVLSALLIGLFSLGGIALAYWLRTLAVGNPDPRAAGNVFYYLFAHHEVAGLSIVALFNLAATVFFFRCRKFAKPLRHPRTLSKFAEMPNKFIPITIAIVVFATANIGTSTVFHDYLLTADENLADFQAKIFLHGQVQAEVPSAWAPAANVIRAVHTDYSPAKRLWNANYLPVYAAMRALFESVDLQELLNPLLAAITILALYGTVRNIWPESKTIALIAIGLLASSSQFLLMSMTGYAMPAHLALNTIWLWLYSRRNGRVFYLAPIIGILAIGLHQPIVHALFVLPFLARLVWQRRWPAVAIFGAIYLAGCAGWLAWKMHFETPSPPGTGGLASMFRLFNSQMTVIQPMNLLLIIGWACLATPLLAIIGFKQFFKSRPMIQDAILSCVLTFGFYYFFYLDQAHGWGYRYFHGTLSCFIIVAVAGFSRLSILIGQTRALSFVAAGIALSILAQFPLRCIQAEKFVKPFANAAEALHSIHADIVAFNPLEAWYSADLIRNDPFLEQRPVLVALFGLTPPAVTALQKNGSARFITRAELANLGLSTTPYNHFGRDPFELGRGK